MSHEEAVLFVPDLDSGRLDPEKEAMVRSHVAGCEECTGLSEAYRVVATALRLESEHPDSKALVEHATGVFSGAGLEAHLASCPSCARQVAAIRAAESELARRISARRLLAWAASVTLPLLLGYLGWVQWRVLPGMRDELTRARESGAPEAVGLPLLTPTLRGGEEPVTVVVRAGQHSIAVAVAAALPGELADAEALRIEVRNERGVVVYSRATSAGEIRRLSGRSGAFALLLPASLLPEGEASLHLGASAGGELLATPFRVRRE